MHRKVRIGIYFDICATLLFFLFCLFSPVSLNTVDDKVVIAFVMGTRLLCIYIGIFMKEVTFIFFTLALAASLAISVHIWLTIFIAEVYLITFVIMQFTLLVISMYHVEVYFEIMSELRARKNKPRNPETEDDVWCVTPQEYVLYRELEKSVWLIRLSRILLPFEITVLYFYLLSILSVGNSQITGWLFLIHIVSIAAHIMWLKAGDPQYLALEKHKVYDSDNDYDSDSDDDSDSDVEEEKEKVKEKPLRIKSKEELEYEKYDTKERLHDSKRAFRAWITCCVVVFFVDFLQLMHVMRDDYAIIIAMRWMLFTIVLAAIALSLYIATGFEFRKRVVVFYFMMNYVIFIIAYVELFIIILYPFYEVSTRFGHQAKFMPFHLLNTLGALMCAISSDGNANPKRGIRDKMTVSLYILAFLASCCLIVDMYVIGIYMMNNNSTQNSPGLIVLRFSICDYVVQSILLSFSGIYVIISMLLISMRKTDQIEDAYQTIVNVNTLTWTDLFYPLKRSKTVADKMMGDKTIALRLWYIFVVALKWILFIELVCFTLFCVTLSTVTLHHGHALPQSQMQDQTMSLTMWIGVVHFFTLTAGFLSITGAMRLDVIIGLHSASVALCFAADILMMLIIHQDVFDIKSDKNLLPHNFYYGLTGLIAFFLVCDSLYVILIIIGTRKTKKLHYTMVEEIPNQEDMVYSMAETVQAQEPPISEKKDNK